MHGFVRCPLVRCGALGIRNARLLDVLLELIDDSPIGGCEDHVFFPTPTSWLQSSLFTTFSLEFGRSGKYR